MLKTIHSLLQPGIVLGAGDRPSQLMFDHDISADYFAWPGLRERLVLTGSQILTDEFFSNFALSFRLIWKQELSAVYAFDPITELYSLSRRFTESLRDIQNWTMDQKFFEAFPEIYYDFTLGI
ncbi:hypothetical protein N7508_008880 [Penicillium antarcticum]|uniref:uncharacterized protein n=1 Tax=Penicillium antarcticum TaxID=416450 RepID=UPI00239C3141|nr:uncharacterized protein N7508_008880 [Penicillium antarcticum]KAJ5294059.1 hypothetical protein N7508_008880 [Penicillium antarcticum]